MKFKIKYLLLIGGLLSLTLSACEDFDKLNVDPNNPTPETVDPNFLLTSVQIHGTLDMHLYQRIHNLYVDNFAQYFVNDKYTSNNCVPVDSWNQDYWDAHWGWICSLNDIINNYNEDPLKVNSVQIARIWKVWLFHRATDIFGDIPYFKAANGSGEAAIYDPQKDIYYDMLKELAESSEKLNDKFPNPGKNDLIFRGDVLKWKKFANSYVCDWLCG